MSALDYLTIRLARTLEVPRGLGPAAALQTLTQRGFGWAVSAKTVVVVGDKVVSETADGLDKVNIAGIKCRR